VARIEALPGQESTRAAPASFPAPAATFTAQHKPTPAYSPTGIGGLHVSVFI
jgi:hypothetical protein